MRADENARLSQIAAKRADMLLQSTEQRELMKLPEDQMSLQVRSAVGRPVLTAAFVLMSSLLADWTLIGF